MFPSDFFRIVEVEIEHMELTESNTGFAIVVELLENIT
jgi:hypothetical protein